MNPYGSGADDFYVNMQLQTALDLPQQRETLMHFFEQVQRRFPRMDSLSVRDKEIYLEEDKENSTSRWVSTDMKRVSAGIINPPSLEEALALHQAVLSIIPYSLSISHLDCEALNLVFGFDFTCRGNHNQLLADVLGLPTAFESAMELDGVQCMGYEPSIQLSLDADVKIHARISFETRSPIRPVAGEYPEEQLSVYLAVRRVESLSPAERFENVMQQLADSGQRLIDEVLVPNILQPLQKAIALQ
jgi:hypothetical protein